MQIRSTVFEGLFGSPEHNNKKSLPSVVSKKGANRVLEITAELVDLLVRVNDYMLSKENTERKQTEQNITSETMKVSVKPLEMKLSSLEN